MNNKKFRVLDTFTLAPYLELILLILERWYQNQFFLSDSLYQNEMRKDASFFYLITLQLQIL